MTVSGLEKFSRGKKESGWNGVNVGKHWNSQMELLKQKRDNARLLHANTALEKKDIGIGDNTQQVEGAYEYDPQLLKGLSGVEGDTSVVDFKPLKGVFDVQLFIETSASNRKGKENIDSNIEDGDKQSDVKKQKEIHDGLLQRLRSAAGYRESSLLKTSVLAISDSLEGVSVDSLLSQVLQFDLSALYLRGMEDKKGALI